MQKIDRAAKLVQWKILLIENYKTLSLTEDEVMIILLVDYCLINGETFVTPDMLALKMNLEFSQIDKDLTKLIKKGLINIDEVDGKLVTSLAGIQDLLVKIVIADYNKKEALPSENKEAQDNLYQIFENEFGRPLSFVEVDTIRSWFDEGYTKDKIILALKEAVVARAKNIRYIDKILLEWRQQDERSKEGYTTISPEWRKNIDESVKIANINWVDKNGKK